MGNRLMIAGEKESFILRVLLKKVNEAGIDYEFVPWKVTNINSKWNGTTLVTLFIDEGKLPGDDVLHFLSDKAKDSDVRFVIIGSKSDIEYVSGKVPANRIYRSFVRPADNDAFVAAVKDHFSKVETGEYKKSLLIVDDDPGFLGLAREWLKDTYKVTGVSSGMQAIKWLGKNSADLILLDYEMPVTTGPQVFEMLRSDEDTKNIPVMFLTGKSDRESVMAVLSLKPDGYFLKTIRKEELLTRLEEFFLMHS